LVASLIVAACGSNQPASTAAAKCPDALMQQRDRDVQSAEIAVVGKWSHSENDVTPGIGVEIGTIAVSKPIKGSLKSDDLIGIVTGEVTDPGGKTVQCALTVPPGTEERVFYVEQGEHSLRVIDHRPSTGSN
jgi:hypothetical protein